MIQKANIHNFFHKFRIFLISFLFIIFGALCVKSSAYATKYENIKIGDFTYDLDNSNKTAVVTKYNPGFWSKLFSSTVTIPETVEYKNAKFSVKTIGYEFAKGNEKIKKVIGKSIKDIGNYAFQDCNGLKSVNFPNVTSIGLCAFDSSGLTSADFPNATEILSAAFNGCVYLKDINLPNAVSINKIVFENCRNLTNINLPKVNWIGERIFDGCDSLQTIEAPNLTNCSKNIFHGLREGVTFKVPLNMKNFGLEALPNVDKINIVYIGDTDKSNWGKKIINNGFVNYVDSSGKTSAEVTGNKMIWLKETSDGTSAWYAVDNSKGIFKTGSRFWVKWLSPEVDSEEFYQYYNKLDYEHKKKVENNKLWIFLTGVTDPDGNEYKTWDGTINYYIQLGDDWDKNDIKTVFISENKDEAIKVSYEKKLNYPEGKTEFAKLDMKHFSAYGIYDSESTESANTKKSASVKTGLIEKTTVLGFMFTASLLSIAVLNRKLKIFN